MVETPDGTPADGVTLHFGPGEREVATKSVGDGTYVVEAPTPFVGPFVVRSDQGRAEFATLGARGVLRVALETPTT